MDRAAHSPVYGRNWYGMAFVGFEGNAALERYRVKSWASILGLSIDM
jgi:hypothetical protein